jgi:hypothetical protein
MLIGGQGARMPDDYRYHLLPSGAGRQLLPQKQLERGTLVKKRTEHNNFSKKLIFLD